MAILSWNLRGDGAVFNCTHNMSPLPVDQWGKGDVLNVEGRLLNIGPLLVSLENEIGVQIGNDRILIPWRYLALFDPSELKNLDLPVSSQFRLKITGSGNLLLPGFSFNWQFTHPTGQPVMGVNRQGTVLTVGRDQYCLLDPIYSLVEMMETFNALSPDGMEERLLLWGRMKDLLPEDAVVDNYLRGINVAPADAFTLELCDEGEAIFNPVLVKAKAQLESKCFSENPGNNFETLLPEAVQENFNRFFSSSTNVMGRYALAGGWFVAIPPSLEKALSVVRDFQTRPVEERRAFISNPRAVLQQVLGEIIDEQVIDDLFYESPEFLSARIKYLGEWVPKVGAFLFSAKEQWLGGPEELGLPLGKNTIVRVHIEDIPYLIEEIKKAQQEGRPEVEYRSQKISATEDSLNVLSGNRPAARPEGGDEDEPGEKDPVAPKIVPIIRDNLFDEEFSSATRQRNGRAQEIPQGLKSALLPHQRVGLFWLQTNWIVGSSGALLADDMGLGKTFQSLAFLQWVKGQMVAGNCPRQPFLIVAPTGLLKNWEEEAGIHLVSPGLGNLLRAYGSEFSPFRRMTETRAAQEIVKFDWVLTTYETLRDYIRIFIKIDWGVTFFDEVQKIKNPSAMMTDMAKSLQSEFTVALTGTPVENRLADLWCIVDTVQPGLLKDLRSFSRTYESEDGSVQTERCAALKTQLVETPPKVMLRRLKEDHLEGLPSKNSHLIVKTMPSEQAVAYHKAVLEARRAGRQQGKMLQAIQSFRSISLHPFIYDGSMDNDTYASKSARLEATFEILDRVAEKKEKALVFLESKQMQQWIVPYIQRRYDLEHPPMVINGAVSGPKRQERVRIFQNLERNNFDVMILSPKAGGVGLTLTAANHVIHLSRWWNPAVEDQCTDRVFRIGQKKDVNVYYPMAVHPEIPDNSFDANLNRLLERKRSLSREVLAPPGGTSADAEDLFNDTVNDEPEVGDAEPFTLEEIDLMEPLAFEDFVLSTLRIHGYSVQKTPVSGDRGADGVAVSPAGSGKPSYIIQCKHTQTQNLCNESAVEEVLRSLPAYQHITAPLKPLVVSTARDFTRRAHELGREKGVQLVCRHDLIAWLNNPC